VLRDSSTYREPTPIISDSEDEFGPEAEGANLTSHVHIQDDQDIPDVMLSPEEVMNFALATTALEPRTYAEALKRPDADFWKEAAAQEIYALIENGTYELVELPPDRKTIGSRWVFKVKRKTQDGSVDRYKARVVAKGYKQRPGLDFTETFAPTVKYSALRTILAIAAIEDLELESVDISTAFLNGDIDTEIYVEQPEGFQERGPGWVWRLLKSLYGLKQSPRLWNQKLHAALQDMGFIRTRSDHSVYIYVRDGVRMIIPIFVDDLTLVSKSMAAINKVKQELGERFKLRDLGPTESLLGIKITRDRAKRTLCLSQRQYIIEALERYRLSDCTPVKTPMEPGLRLSKDMAPKTPEEEAQMKGTPYMNAVGSLMYLAITTRPDIAYAVGVLCRFNQNPGVIHWKAVKHLFRYLKGTMDEKLVYSPTISDEPFTSFSDADHGGNPDNGKSTSGHLIRIGTGAVSWSSKLQPVVALSTTEAEYIAAVHAGKEVIWLRHLLIELGYDLPSPSRLQVDNQSAISVAKNPEHHGRMKHLDLRFFWLKDEVEAGVIELVHTPTDEMAADELTKALPRVKVDRSKRMMGLGI